MTLVPRVSLPSTPAIPACALPASARRCCVISRRRAQRADSSSTSLADASLPWPAGGAKDLPQVLHLSAEISVAESSGCVLGEKAGINHCPSCYPRVIDDTPPADARKAAAYRREKRREERGKVKGERLKKTLL